MKDIQGSLLQARNRMEAPPEWGRYNPSTFIFQVKEGGDRDGHCLSVQATALHENQKTLHLAESMNEVRQRLCFSFNGSIYLLES